MGRKKLRSLYRTLQATVFILRGLLLTCLFEELSQLVEDVSLASMWFIHNRVLAHCIRDIKQSFDSHYQNRSIKRSGADLLPPPSPNLTLSNFRGAIWGYSLFEKSQHARWALTFLSKGWDYDTTHTWNSSTHQEFLASQAQLCIQTKGEHFFNFCIYFVNFGRAISWNHEIHALLIYVIYLILFPNAFPFMLTQWLWFYLMFPGTFWLAFRSAA